MVNEGLSVPPSRKDGVLRRPDHVLPRTNGGHILVRRLLNLARDTYRYITFPRRYAAFRGVYKTYEQALAAVPAGQPMGYDHPALAQQYIATLPDRPQCYDYPMLFWLGCLIDENTSIF